METARLILFGILLIGFFSVLGVAIYMKSASEPQLIATLSAAFSAGVGYLFGRKQGEAAATAALKEKGGPEG